VGNALGAWLGGVTITAGLGYTSPIWAGAGITVLGLGVMLFAAAKAKRNAATPVTTEVRPDSGAPAPAGSLADSGAPAPAGSLDPELQRS
jgi:DHA1 family inner membrane transport protein